MVDKVPSFKNGGAYWFMDLTATDGSHIFPSLIHLYVFIYIQVGIHGLFILVFLSAYSIDLL